MHQMLFNYVNLQLHWDSFAIISDTQSPFLQLLSSLQHFAFGILVSFKKCIKEVNMVKHRLRSGSYVFVSDQISLEPSL